MKKSLIALSLLVLGQGVWAEDLAQIYQRAQENDPRLKISASSLAATQEARRRSLGNLLPSISLSANTSFVHSDADSVSSSSEDSYQNSDTTLSLTQPIYRRDRWIALDQADSRIDQADAEYRTARQDLMLRTATAYFAVLSAQDGLSFQRAELKAIERQLDQAKQRFEVGLIAITGVHESQARYDEARANEIQAGNALDNNWESLREIVGPLDTQLSELQEKIPLELPQPADIGEWSQTAQRNNPAIQAAMQVRDIARKGIEVSNSGHYPTLDLVSSYKESWQDNSANDSDSDSASIGLQFVLPLYAGGSVSAATREATHNAQIAEDQLDQQRRSVEKQVRDAYRGVAASISRVKALAATVKSSQSALDATTAGFEVGTRTMVDVLNSQRDLFRSLRDYSAARYDYIVNGLRLKQAAGVLSQDDLALINGWLQQPNS